MKMHLMVHLIQDRDKKRRATVSIQPTYKVVFVVLCVQTIY